MHDVATNRSENISRIVAHFANPPDDVDGHIDGHGGRATAFGQFFLAQHHVVERGTAPTKFTRHDESQIARLVQELIKRRGEGAGAVVGVGLRGNLSGHIFGDGHHFVLGGGKCWHSWLGFRSKRRVGV